MIKEIIFDEDLENNKKSDKKTYTIASIVSEIRPTIEYDLNCLNNNFIFTNHAFNYKRL